MKKILVLISLILCLSMIFTACNKTDVEDGDTDVEERVDSVEANIAMLVKLFNTYENAGQIYDKVTEMTKQETVIDLSKIAEELKKVEAQGSVSMNVEEDGEDLGSGDFSIAIKDNNLHFEGEAEGDKIGLDAYLTDSLQFVFAAWEEYEGEMDIAESFSIDINALMDQYMGMMEEAMSQVTETEMPIDLKEVVLGGIKAEDIEYKDGKYYLKKDAIYNSIMATVDSFIDAAADEGILPEGFDEQYDEIKTQVKSIVDAVELDIYFLVKYETIEGLGMNANVVMADLAKAMGVEDAETGDFEYIKAAFEVSINGESINVEFKQGGKVNKVNANMEFVTEGEKALGINMTYAMDINTVSKYTSGHEEYNPETDNYERVEVEIANETAIKADMTAKIAFIYDGEAVSGCTADYDLSVNDSSKRTENGTLDYNSTDKITMDASAVIDFSKFDDANATVLDVTFKMTDDYKRTGEDAYESKDAVTFTASIKTTEANKANFAITATENYNSQSANGEPYSRNNDFKINGTVEFKTENVTVPAPNAAVKDAMDEAKANPVDIEDLMGGAKEEEEVVIPMPEPDYNYDEMVPEYDYAA